MCEKTQKSLGGLAALLVALLALFSGDRAAAAPDRPLVFVPGILGSRLCREVEGDQIVVWGTIGSLRHIGSLGLSAGADDVRPCGLVREVSVLGPLQQDFYGPILDRLEAAGYREGETLFVFDYDWRRSAFDNAERLSHFIDVRLPPGSRFDILAHSMGGLVARTYLLEEGGAPLVQHFIAAGTPWFGSVKLFDMLENGYGPVTPLLGGIERVRRTILSFPSIYELAPAYDGCCGAEGAGFDAGRPETWPALGWAGIDDRAIPNPSLIETRRARLAEIVATPLPETVDEGLVIAVDQRTPESFGLSDVDGARLLAIRTSWDGDGVVPQTSARMQGRTVYPTSFAVHHAILNDPNVQEFVLAALRSGTEAAVARVPVRPRDQIETTLGHLVSLIGVAVTTDAAAYATDEEVQIRVILRLDAQEPVDATALTLHVTRPDGAVTMVATTRDPAGTDNPFEQVFEARLRTGPQEGLLKARAELDVQGNQQRAAEATVPILAR